MGKDIKKMKKICRLAFINNYKRGDEAKQVK